MMNSASAVMPAFRDPARQSQAAFRTIMDAMARPGRISRLAAGFEAPAPLSTTAAVILLTLADFETSIWLDETLSGAPEVAAFLRFHTGASIVSAPEQAGFAVLADSANAPPLAAFAQGLPDYPDRSTTLILQVQGLARNGWTFAGPGIESTVAFSASPVPDDFTAQLAGNRARYPLGVDLIFAAPGEIAALPRSARLVEAR
jgi:alpha-D-ribose 1-methylphosphonate 5-triphosphate synthase subunit PhnH